MQYGQGQEPHEPTQPTGNSLACLQTPVMVRQRATLLHDVLQPRLEQLAQCVTSHDDATSARISDGTKISSERTMRAAFQKLSGELVLQGVMYSGIIEVVNDHLARYPFDTEAPHGSASIRMLYWRLVGSGTSPKTDFELVLMLSDGSEHVIASLSMSINTVLQMQSRYTAGYEVNALGGGDAPDTITLQVCSSSSSVRLTILQVQTQLAAKQCQVGLLSNYDAWILFFMHSPNDCHSSPIILPTDATLPDNLSHSPLGLLLGASLLALDVAGYSSTWHPVLTESSDVETQPIQGDFHTIRQGRSNRSDIPLDSLFDGAQSGPSGHAACDTREAANPIPHCEDSFDVRTGRCHIMFAVRTDIPQILNDSSTIPVAQQPSLPPTPPASNTDAESPPRTIKDVNTVRKSSSVKTVSIPSLSIIRPLTPEYSPGITLVKPRTVSIHSFLPHHAHLVPAWSNQAFAPAFQPRRLSLQL